MSERAFQITGTIAAVAALGFIGFNMATELSARSHEALDTAEFSGDATQAGPSVPSASSEPASLPDDDQIDPRWKDEEALTKRLSWSFSLPVGEPIALFQALRPSFNCTTIDDVSTLCENTSPGLADCPSSAPCTHVTYFFENGKVSSWTASYPEVWWNELYKEAKETFGEGQYGGKEIISYMRVTGTWRQDGLEVTAIKNMGTDVYGRPLVSPFDFSVSTLRESPPG